MQLLLLYDHDHVSVVVTLYWPSKKALCIEQDSGEKGQVHAYMIIIFLVYLLLCHVRSLFFLIMLCQPPTEEVEVKAAPLPELKH